MSLHSANLPVKSISVPTVKPVLFFLAGICFVILGSCTTEHGNKKARAKSDRDIITSDLNVFIDSWHKAASVADADAFFGSMADSSIYIGTDATERWSKPEFVTFAKPYFDRGTAWDFKPYDRDIHISEDGRHVWFSELLTTWMGICRGSGVIVKSDKGWKIEQYHLSVTVPNDLIRDFISLVDQFEKAQEKEQK